MFKLLGIAILAYTLFSAATGSVHAKAGIRLRTVTRSASPIYFWVIIAIYTALGIALLTIF